MAQRLIAVTGGIGSGKSEVMRILGRHTKNLLSADAVNSELLDDPVYIGKLSALFPEAVKDGSLDKKILSDTVFSSGEKRKLLNGLAHSLIMDILLNRAKEMRGDVFLEIPLLAESGTAGLLDFIWLVKSADSFRVSRLKMQRGMTEDNILRIIGAQAGFLSDGANVRIIENDGNAKELEERVLALYAELKKTEYF